MPFEESWKKKSCSKFVLAHNGIFSEEKSWDNLDYLNCNDWLTDFVTSPHVVNPLSCDIYHCALRWKQLRYQFHGTAGYWLMILSLWRLHTNPRHRLAFKTAGFFTFQITPDRTRSSYFPPAQLFWHEKPRVVSRKHPSTGSTLQQLHLFFLLLVHQLPTPPTEPGIDAQFFTAIFRHLFQLRGAISNRKSAPEPVTSTPRANCNHFRKFSTRKSATLRQTTTLFRSASSMLVKNRENFHGLHTKAFCRSPTPPPPPPKAHTHTNAQR